MQGVPLDDACRAGISLAARKPDLEPVGFDMSGYLVMLFRHSVSLLFFAIGTKVGKKSEHGKKNPEHTKIEMHGRAQAQAFAWF